jgi:hypothetical protein
LNKDKLEEDLAPSGYGVDAVKSLDESNSNIMRAFVCSCDGEFRAGVDPTPAIHAFVLSLVRASPPLRFLQV